MNGDLQEQVVSPLGEEGRAERSVTVCCVAEMAAGLFEADLGGGLLKKRIAREGQGKSGGFRTLVATNRGDRWIFVFGFSKNVRSNIDKDEQEALKKLAEHLLGLTPKTLGTAVAAGELIEVNCDEED